MADFPYLARTTLKYKSPHPTDLSFAKDETIRVTGPSDDDEDWLVGETLDGSKSGGFPKDFIVRVEDSAADQETSAPASVSPVAAVAPSPPAQPVKSDPAPPLPAAAPAPPSPKFEPAELPPSSRASPAPAKVAPKSDSAETTDDDPAKKSMKDRLAFFAAAQNKAGPPPPLKPKPAAGGLTWSQRQKLKQEQEAKEKEAGGDVASTGAATVTAPAPVSEAKDTPSAVPASPSRPSGDSGETKEGSGMSAADAQSSIGKGSSLKERMAALRGAGAFGAPEAKTAPPPPVKPSGKVWSRPAAPEPQPDQDDDGEVADSTESGDVPVSHQSVEAEGEGTEAAAEEPAEEDEEEQEKARRAAITARMAKLGARGPMGMAPVAPPKPTRKPTIGSQPSSPIAEKSESSVLSRPDMTSGDTGSAAKGSAEPNTIASEPAKTESATSPPASVAMPAIPRRTAGPRKPARSAASAAPATTPAPAEASQIDDEELEKRVERVHPDGTISPPPAVMVANEEPPLPRTEEGLKREQVHTEAGAGPQGAAGAKAAGIAVASTGGNESEDGQSVTGMETGDAQGLQQAKRSLPPPEMVPVHPPAPSRAPTGSDSEEEDSPELTRTLSPAQAILGLPKDEIEMKHEQDARAQQEDEADEEDEEEEDEAPPPPPRRMSADHPSGPRPLPAIPGTTDRSNLPPPPTRVVGSIPPPDLSEEEEEEEAEMGQAESDGEEEDDVPPPPPPQRQPSMRLPPRPTTSQDEEEEQTAPPPPARRPTLPPPPAPAADSEDEEDESEPAPPPPPRRETTIVPIEIPSGGQAKAPGEPILSSPTAPKIATSPTNTSTLERQPTSSAQTEQNPVAEDDEEARRKGIAARMAKLGGIKFGMPPPVPKVKRSNTVETQEPASPSVERTQQVSAVESSAPSTPISPTIPKRAAPPTSAAEPEHDNPDETPEQEAERRRRTLARLRAGGTLGFGMFGQGHASQQTEDERGLEEEDKSTPQTKEAAEEVDEEDGPPPPPTARPPVPSNRPLPTAPSQSQVDGEITEAATTAPVPPVPTGRPPVPTNRPIPPPPEPVDDENTEEADEEADEEETQIAAPPPPARPSRSQTSEVIPSPIRSTSTREVSLPNRLPPPPLGQPIHNEPEATDEFSDIPPPTPDRPSRPPAIQTHSQVSNLQQPASESPRRSMSIASRQSTSSIRGPASPGVARQDSQSGRPSFAGSRPGFNELQAASQDAGTRVLRAAQGLYAQGKRAYVGDGSAAGFITTVFDQAQLPRPEQSWGQLVYEQEATSVLKKYDDARPGDIAAFYDARLKGKKGLSSYNQHVGSVEDPLVGVIVESEQKKHKLRVVQVERGVMEEVSYRCDDLKSGRILVYRPGA